MHLRKLILVILLSGLVTAGFAAQQRMVDAETVIARSVADREPVGAREEFRQTWASWLRGQESLVPRTRPLNMSGATRGMRTSFS